jgi:hypothetical protein
LDRHENINQRHEQPFRKVMPTLTFFNKAQSGARLPANLGASLRCSWLALSDAIRSNESGLRFATTTLVRPRPDRSSYPDEVEVPSFGRRAKCSKCGGRRVDVRPNWEEKPGMPGNWQGRPAGET